MTWAHWGLKKNNRRQLNIGMFLTIALGCLFLFLQAYEYHHAYTEMGLTLGMGAYGATFFMLTGFHGFHVTLGTIMLIVILSDACAVTSSPITTSPSRGVVVLALRGRGVAAAVRPGLLAVAAVSLAGARVPASQCGLKGPLSE